MLPCTLKCKSQYREVHGKPLEENTHRSIHRLKQVYSKPRMLDKIKNQNKTHTSSAPDNDVEGFVTHFRKHFSFYAKLVRSQRPGGLTASLQFSEKRKTRAVSHQERNGADEMALDYVYQFLCVCDRELVPDAIHHCLLFRHHICAMLNSYR